MGRKADVKSPEALAARPCGMEARDKPQHRTQVNSCAGWSVQGECAYQHDARYPTAGGTSRPGLRYAPGSHHKHVSRSDHETTRPRDRSCDSPRRKQRSSAPCARDSILQRAHRTTASRQRSPRRWCDQTSSPRPRTSAQGPRAGSWDYRAVSGANCQSHSQLAPLQAPPLLASARPRPGAARASTVSGLSH